MNGNEILEHNKEKFALYEKELLFWNEKFNLTAITSPDEIRIKHFLDSLTLLPYLPQNATSVADIGSGAGFPGIPLAIARPDLKITLIESIGKKAKFLEHVVSTLQLSNVEVVCARAEEVAKHKDYKGLFDVVVARAVAKLDILVSYMLPLLKKGGVMLAQKSSKENPEDASKMVKKFSGEIKAIHKVEGTDERVIVEIQKIC